MTRPTPQNKQQQQSNDNGIWFVSTSSSNTIQNQGQSTNATSSMVRTQATPIYPSLHHISTPVGPWQMVSFIMRCKSFVSAVLFVVKLRHSHTQHLAADPQKSRVRCSQKIQLPVNAKDEEAGKSSFPSVSSLNRKLENPCAADCRSDAFVMLFRV